MSEEKTFRAAYATLQKHAQTLRSQQEPDIDNLTTIVIESVDAYKICKQRIDAVEKALEQALGNAQIESDGTAAISRRQADQRLVRIATLQTRMSTSHFEHLQLRQIPWRNPLHANAGRDLFPGSAWPAGDQLPRSGTRSGVPGRISRRLPDSIRTGSATLSTWV